MIALDTTSDSGFSNSIWSHTCTGSNLILIVSVISNGTPLTVTYAGNQLTKIGGSRNESMWALINAPAGTANIAVTYDSGSQNQAFGASYTGVDRIDSFNSANFGASPTTVSTTVLLSNCWLVGFGTSFQSSAGSQSVSQNRTSRKTTSASLTNLAGVYSDSNGTVGTGSQGIIYTGAFGGNNGNATVIAIAPPQAPASSTAFLLASY